jgi:hypothetical protein
MRRPGEPPSGPAQLSVVCRLLGLALPRGLPELACLLYTTGLVAPGRGCGTGTVTIWICGGAGAGASAAGWGGGRLSASSTLLSAWRMSCVRWLSVLQQRRRLPGHLACIAAAGL